jgi:hypothetical protein
MKTIHFLLLLFIFPFEMFSATQLSNSEKEGIILMREEEKLAHDVYKYLFEKWELNIFSNIMGAEMRHFNAMGYLIDNFELKDPAYEKPGKFRNKTLQSLYDSLIIQGSVSETAALQVGAYIEEVDIRDLQQLINETENENIQMVYKNLLRASGNHLRAFTGQLANRDQTYIPVVLSGSEYETVLQTPHQKGMGNGSCMKQNNCKNKDAGGKGRRYRGERGNS